jgi:archaellum component FlaC
MDKLIDRILEKLDKIDDRLNDIDKTLVKNTESLEQHMMRTSLLETHVKALEKEVLPIAKHVTKVEFVVSIAKWVGASSLLSAAIILVKYVSNL